MGERNNDKLSTELLTNVESVVIVLGVLFVFSFRNKSHFIRFISSETDSRYDQYMIEALHYKNSYQDHIVTSILIFRYVYILLLFSPKNMFKIFLQHSIVEHTY